MKKIYRQYFLIIGICAGLTIWGIYMHNRIISTSDNENIRNSGRLRDQLELKLTNKKQELTNQLDALENEIIRQRYESNILLDKIRSKYGSNAGPIEIKVERDKLKQNEDKLQALRQELQQNAVHVGGEVKSLEEMNHGDGNNENSNNQLANNVNSHNSKNFVENGQLKPIHNNDNADTGAHEIIDDQSNSKEAVIAILVFVCNRPSITRCLDKLLQYRPSVTKFPIIVSQDCGNSSSMTSALLPYEDKVTHIWQPDLKSIPVPPRDSKYEGYYKIARHYGWALNHTFYHLNYSNVIIVEDDLEVAEDFFEYFSATLPILRKDPSLWCVSAWNDNGKSKRINEKSPELLYRTDFFPGLGWMMTKELWNELSPKWPKGFWDDWMREPPQRKNRACIRPEISRTSTFGKEGVSQGTYYLNHLRYIKLNDKFVPFTKMDLSYLLKENYDTEFLRRVYSAQVLKTIPELNRVISENESSEAEYRLTYRNKDTYRTFALKLELMDDLRAGVPRTAYRGIVTFMLNNHRVYLAPGANWSGYQP